VRSGPPERRAWLERLESDAAGELSDVALAFLAAPEVSLDPELLHGARRRALLLLAAGGDPLRELDPDGRAVRSLADELDAPERRGELRRALERMRRAADGLPRVVELADGLLADDERAWRSLATALLADELAGGDDSDDL
jgi:hypothetical protein